MNCYLLPGLGFDERIFEKLDFSGQQTIPLNWIEPLPKEAIADYARRLSSAIPKTATPILIGHSMGGVVAQEIAAQRPVKAIILLSSIRSRRELPRHFRLLQPLGLHRLFWKAPTLRTVKYWGRGHGYKSPEELALFKSMVGRHSNRYLQWALRTLSIWKAPTLPYSTPVFQIHGSADRTFPASKIEAADVMLDGGGHLLLYKRAEEISGIIQGFLREVENHSAHR